MATGPRATMTSTPRPDEVRGHGGELAGAPVAVHVLDHHRRAGPPAQLPQTTLERLALHRGRLGGAPRLTPRRAGRAPRAAPPR